MAKNYLKKYGLSESLAIRVASEARNRIIFLRNAAFMYEGSKTMSTFN